MRTNTTLAALLLAAGLSIAGDGHDHGPMPGAATAGSGNWITVSEAGMRNLELETATAHTRELHRVLPAIGIIEPAPGRSSEITSRIAGQVHSLEVAEGETVRKGQVLLRILSGQPGDPPPVITVEAPRSGTVTRLHVAPGSRVSPEEHLLDVVDLDVVHARAIIHEGQIRELRMGQTARVRPAAWPDSLWTGRLVRLGGELDPESGTLPAWFELRNPRGSLRANMRARLTILAESRSSALVVPAAAVLGEHGQRFVFVARDLHEGVFERVEVSTGLEDDLGIEVLSGVHAGDEVVIRGNYSLQYLPRQPEPPEGLHLHEEADGHEDPGHGEEGHVHSDEEAPARGEEGHIHSEGEDATHAEEDVHTESDGHAGAAAHDEARGHTVMLLLQAALGLSLLGNLWLLIRRDTLHRGSRTEVVSVSTPTDEGNMA
jgi:cobalt-zinc-cadmium efflux system membrane fusion protein